MSNPASINSTATDTAAVKGLMFPATFIAAKRGVQTRQRVHGRRAFPSASSYQPRAGETWMVKVVAENPSRSVYFVKCLRLICSCKTNSGRDPGAGKLNVSTSPVPSAEAVAQAEMRALAWSIARGRWHVDGYKPKQIELRNTQLFYARRMKKLKHEGELARPSDIADVRGHLDLVSRRRKELKDNYLANLSELKAAEEKRLLSTDIPALDAAVVCLTQSILTDYRVVYSMDSGKAFEFAL